MNEDADRLRAALAEFKEALLESAPGKALLWVVERLNKLLGGNEHGK